MSDLYDRHYYLTSCGLPYERNEHWEHFFGEIADHIVKEIGPRTVLDAGCAKGFLVEALRDRGVEAYGIDISAHAIGEVRVDIREFCKVASILEPLEQHYDLIISIEVLEHLSATEGKKAIANLCKHTDEVIFSSTPSDFKESTHQNVKPPEYWAEIFACNGFIHDLDYEAGYIAGHAMRFVRTRKNIPAIVREYERKQHLYSLENRQLRQLSLETRNALSSAHAEKERLEADNQRLEEDSKRLEEDSKRLEEDSKREIDVLRTELDAIQRSIVWSFISRFHSVITRLLPVSSRRRRIYDIMIKSGQILVNEGWNSCWMSIKSYSKPKERKNIEYLNWITNNEPLPISFEKMKKKCTQLQYKPKISIITPVWNTEEKWLRNAIESVLDQIYENWELCIADGGSIEPHVKDILEEYAQKDPRIRIKYIGKNKGIAGNSQEALSNARGEFITFLDHDDEFLPFTLFEVVSLLNEKPDLDFIYSDEDKINEEGVRKDPFFKPDWSPDTFLSCNYPIHITVIRKDLVDRVGGFREGYDGSQDYDLFLRVTEQTVPEKIAHIPKILYHWRMIPSSAASSTAAKPYAYVAAKKALNDAMKRRNMGIEGIEDGLWTGSYRIRYKVERDVKVTIIIPTKDNVDILKKCISSILLKTDYSNYEILLIDNKSEEERTFRYYREIKENPHIRILEYNHSFNFSTINNYGVSKSDAEFVVFLNNDIEVISEEWLLAMLEHAQRRDVGAVGVKLLFPNNLIQHCGIILGRGCDNVAGNLYYRYPESHGYKGRINIVSNCSAVTAACMMMRRSVFQEVGGFDENLAVAFNDVDLCLKIREKGYLIIYTPYAKLFHHESLTRGYEDTPEKKRRFNEEVHYVRKRWGDIIDKGDPYYNENLTKDKPDFSIR